MAEYIEREAALRVLCDACGNAACPKGLIPRCSYYEKMQSIPAADVRPVVKSKWVKMKFFPDWECEKCGSVVSGNTPDPWNYYHYCPNCGADMRSTSMSGTNGEES